MRKFQNITRLVRRERLKTQSWKTIGTFASVSSMRGMRLLRG